MRKVTIKLAGIGLILIASIGTLEALCSAWTWFKFGTLSVTELNARDSGMTAALTKDRASFAATVRPHPYLGIVSNSDGLPESWRLNDVANFPLVKDGSKFTILLTGGSTAMLLGTDCRALPEAFARFDFDGKEVVVLNAAGGGTEQPRQAIALLLYGDVVDAVVSLDGFNESTALGRLPYAPKMGCPSPWFEDMNPLISGFDRIGATWQSGRLRDASNRVNSRAFYLLTKAIRTRLESTESSDTFHRELWKKPKDWSTEQQIAWNMARYKHFIQMMNAMSDSLSIQHAHFIQPAPAIGKVLTEDERRVTGPLEYSAMYQRMTDELAADGAISLLDVFDGETETLYTDAIHCNSCGYRILATRIATELARLWNIPTKAESQQTAQK